MNGLLKLAIEGHGGLRRWEQLSRFRMAASITGAIWALKGQPGLLDGVVLAGGPAVNYPSQYREFDGIMIPTRRRVYVRRPDGTPLPGPSRSSSTSPTSPSARARR
jgi:hypothetical protein